MDASLGPTVPFIDVEIGAADGCDFDFDEDFGASVGGNFDFANLRARPGFRLDHCEDGAGHGSPLMRAELEEQTIYSSLAPGLNPPRRRVTYRSSGPVQRSDTTGHRASRRPRFGGDGVSFPCPASEGRGGNPRVETPCSPICGFADPPGPFSPHIS